MLNIDLPYILHSSFESKEIDCPIYTIVRYIAMDVKFFSGSATYFNGSSIETTGTVFNDT